MMGGVLTCCPIGRVPHVPGAALKASVATKRHWGLKCGLAPAQDVPLLRGGGGGSFNVHCDTDGASNHRG